MPRVHLRNGPLTSKTPLLPLLFIARADVCVCCQFVVGGSAGELIVFRFAISA